MRYEASRRGRRARRVLVCAALTTVAALRAPATLRAATLYWDVNGATAGATNGLTAPGTWGTNTFWSTSSAGTVATGAWVSGSTAQFSAGTDAIGTFTVTVNGNQTASGIDFVTGTVTLNGGTLTLNGTRTIDVAAGHTATVNSTIAGSSGLNKDGGGTLVLGGASTYSSSFTILAGDVQILAGHDVAVPFLFGQGGNLTIDGAGSTFTSDGASLGVSGTTSATTVQNSAAATFTNTLSISNSVAASSIGNMTVQSGGDVSATFVKIGTAGGTGGKGTLTITGAGSTFAQNGPYSLEVGNTNGVSTGKLIVSSGGTYTAPVVTTVYSGSLIDVQAGGLVDFKGDIMIDGGTLQFSGGSFGWTPTNTLTVQAGGKLLAAGGSFTLFGNGMSILVSGAGSQFNQGALSVSSDVDVFVSAGGAISATTLNLATLSTGTTILSVFGSPSTVTVSGATTMGATGGVADVSFLAGATASFAALTLTNAAVPGSSSYFAVQTGADVTVSGNLSAGQGAQTGQETSILVSGSGSTITQTGATTFILGAASTSNTSLLVKSGGVFSTGTGTTTINPTAVVDIVGGTYNANGNVTINGGRLTTDAAGVFALAAAKSLTVQNGGDVVITGPYSAASAATMLVNGAGSTFSTTASLTLGNGSATTVSAGGSMSTGGTFLGVGLTDGNGTLNIDGIGSSLSAGPVNVGLNGFSGLLSFGNGASGNLGVIAVDTSSVVGTNGTLLLQGGSAVTGALLSIATNPTANTGTVTIAGPGSVLTLSGTANIGAASASTAALNLQSGGTLITGAGLSTLNATGSVNIAGGTLKTNGVTLFRTGAGLSITAGGRLDLVDQKLILQNLAVGSWNGSAYTAASALIVAGRTSDGGWDGSGIVTSQTSATSGNFTSIGVATAQQVKGIAPAATATWAGATVTGTDTLVMYTYGGDANLDGKIDVLDYGRIDLNVPLGVSGWFNGDFNYDGKIDVLDYGIIDFNIGIQGAPFATTVAGTPGVASVRESATAVPEFSSISAVVLVSAIGLRRTRGPARERKNST